MRGCAHIRGLRVSSLYIGEIEIWCFFANPMYRLGSYKGVTGVFLRFFEMFFPGLYRVKIRGLRRGPEVLRGFTFLSSEINSFTC